MSHIFISHVEEDADIALGIALGLEEAGYTTWCYQLDSIPGPSYLTQTGQAIEQSEAVVLVISPHSLGSHQVTREVVRAYEGAKRFVPVLRDITHVEFQNRQPEWREAVGAATPTYLTQEGVAGILAHVIDGLKALGIHPASKPNAARIGRIHSTLDELQPRGMGEAVEKAEPAKAVKHVVPIRPIAGKVSNWWWFLPAFLGFIGGIISWVINKGANRRKALYMLAFGILSTVIWTVPFFVFFPPVTTPVAPSVTTKAASDMLDNSATLYGNLDDLGGASAVAVSFEWGETSGGPYVNETTTDKMTATGAFSFEFTGLSPDTTYYFRAKADGEDTSYGDEKSFATQAWPPTSLYIGTIQFCSDEPQSFGDYTLQPDAKYYPGDTVWACFEVSNFAKRTLEGGYEIWVEVTEVRGFDPEGKLGVAFSDVSVHHEITDVSYGSVGFWLPYYLTGEGGTGLCRTEVTVEDMISGAIATQSGYCTLASGPSATQD